MLDLLEFSLLDMTPYNRQSWFNLVGEYNQSFKLLFPVAIIVTPLLLGLLFKSNSKFDEYKSVRWVLAILGFAWVWSGAVFHIQYFANLNWAAPWFGGLFIIYGCLLLLTSYFMKSASWVPFTSVRGRMALILLFLGMLIFPLSQLFEGRSYLQLEWFPLLPTPVLLITFAVVILLNSQWRHVLAIIPILWGIVSAAFAMSLGLLEIYFIAGVLLIWFFHVLLSFFSNQNGKNVKK